MVAVLIKRIEILVAVLIKIQNYDIFMRTAMIKRSAIMIAVL